MAKSSRSSSKKFNNQRKAASIFGPAETARQERLSAKLLELAKQAKPEPAEMKIDAMDVDSKKPNRPFSAKKGINKKRKKSSIVFPKYSDRLRKTARNAPKKA
ncbi:hypothetical protein CI102_14802 [Trichoderma harzianum]|uniref:DUF2423 domain-containing protein n=2 Tax=Trichoderma TaxID=5543 RepID=A0A2T3ZTQ5_TRIHA|nr:hypothetical protein M431DRAFT_100708 [Trichoderma harzianum CBS 226.95]XP_056024463.1 uncharacterized protein T069G_10963 [Trichoderma breve]KAJ4855405.1 hypothetical protein T069G_10963 [Trichoderma breve]PKK41030.1 hypothetical protein CI102_14802 [Trichoderma harzianum]PTB48185.1 hypothetical protein M431DRAFT_100708 [Trichoderma harzianum CBS 226.95]